MAKKRLAKKEPNKKKAAAKTEETVKEVVNEEAVIPVDWKIPAAFLAGVIVTSLFFYLPNLLAAGSSESTNLSTIIADAPVTLYVLNDASCSICDSSWIEPRVEMDFFNVTTRYVDVSSAEGMSFLNSLSITSLPAAFFASDVEQAGNYSMYTTYNWIVPVSDYYLLNIQGVKDLTRQESATPTVEVFVMSECPYGVPAQQAMIQALDVISGFELKMHYIGNVYTEAEWNALAEDYRSYYEQYGMCEQRSNGKYYCSLHGPEEVDNDVAQLCAMNYYSNWTTFVTAHINNNMNITAAALEAGYNASLINNCVNSELGWNLYEADIAVASERGVGSSPTYIFDNVITATSNLLVNGPAGLLCSLHPTLSGCENAGSVTVGSATGSC